ncbi:MAG: hypothetical protein ACI9KA_001440 [Parasphingorhabdus sp.]|jgi:hypothetical protein
MLAFIPETGAYCRRHLADVSCLCDGCEAAKTDQGFVAVVNI